MDFSEYSEDEILDVGDLEDRLDVLQTLVEQLQNCTSKAELEIVTPIQLLSQYIRMQDSVLTGILALSREAEKIHQQQIQDATFKFNKLGADFQDQWNQEYWEIYNQLREGSPKKQPRDFQENIENVVDIAINLNRIDRMGKKSVQDPQVLNQVDNISNRYRESTITGNSSESQSKPKSKQDPMTSRRCKCNLF